jgi:hypothetical protein
VLLRAVNVGRHNRVRMDTLRAALTSAGCTDVRSVLQTGNLSLDADTTEPGEVAHTVETVMAELGLARPTAIVRPWTDIVELATATPFGDYDTATHMLTVSFCRSPIPEPPSEPWDERGLTFLGGPPWALFAVMSRGLVGGPNANSIIERRWGIPASTRFWHVVTDWVAREAALTG